MSDVCKTEKPVVWTDEVENGTCHSPQRYLESEKGATFDEKDTISNIKHRVDLLCFGVVWQPAAQETLQKVDGSMDFSIYQQILEVTGNVTQSV